MIISLLLEKGMISGEYNSAQVIHGDHKLSMWSEETGYPGWVGHLLHIKLELLGESIPKTLVETMMFIEIDKMDDLVNIRVCETKAPGAEFNWYKVSLFTFGGILKISISCPNADDVDGYPDPMKESYELNDFSDYDPEMCRNGGKYSFTTKFTYIGEEFWVATYDTSADMDFCTTCGNFGCDHDGCTHEVYTTAEVEGMVERFKSEHEGDENFWVNHITVGEDD